MLNAALQACIVAPTVVVAFIRVALRGLATSRPRRAGTTASRIALTVPLIDDATFGDDILDRLVHYAHRLTLTGGSLRRPPPTSKSPATHADSPIL